MATYEFRCCGITIQLVQPISSPLVQPKCSVCNGDATRIYTPSAAIFNAKGFYSTDK